MNDNIILYAISLICIILLLIEWIFISHKKCSINAIVFVGYSFPLYYLMIYKGAGGAAFTWWFYLVLFTSIHVIILLIIFFSTILRRRANERKQRCDKWNEGCAFFWVTLAYRCVIFTSLWPSILQMVMRSIRTRFVLSNGKRVSLALQSAGTRIPKRWSARQLAGELRHSPVHRDAPHDGSFSILVHSALF